MQALPAPPFPGSLTLCMHPSGICAPNPTQPNQHPLPSLDPTHHPSLWKLNPAGTNNHNKLRQQKALCSFSVPHTHTTHTHTHTHTHPPTLTHSPTQSALSHLPGPAAAVVSVSVSCNSRSVVLPCPAQPSPASPCPARHEVHARALSACPSGRTTAHGSPYRTLPDTTTWHTWHTWHTTRHYSKLLETTTYYHLSHSHSALTGHWHATAHRRRAPLVSPCDIATCNALSIPEPRASSTARPSDPSRHPSNPCAGPLPDKEHAADHHEKRN